MSNHVKTASSLAGVGLAVGVLAACGSITSVSSIDSHVSDFANYRAAAADGVVHVAVSGDAASLSRAQLAGIVEDQFEIAHIGPEATFSADPANVDYGNTRFVIAFNPGDDVNITNICGLSEDEITTAGTQSPVRAIGAFCRGSSANTWTVTTVREGGQNVEIAEFVRSVAHEIIPRPIRDTRCDETPC